VRLPVRVYRGLGRPALACRGAGLHRAPDSGTLRPAVPDQESQKKATDHPAADKRRGRRLIGSRTPLWVVLGMLGLAAVESTNALVAPLMAPSDADWQAAADQVRAGFQTGDLIVAAPAWADPVMRLHLGDLVPVPVAGRLDDKRFGRVWEISQRGARAPESRGDLKKETGFGALTVRLLTRSAPQVHFDTLASWSEAVVTRETPGRAPVTCSRQPTQFLCTDRTDNFVRPVVLEIGHTLRNALYLLPMPGATMNIDFPSVRMGKVLAVGGGLHHVWFRKASQHTVTLRVYIDDQLLLEQISGNRTGWQVDEIDTGAFAGRHARVRFEISSAHPHARHFGFRAESRG